MVQKVSNILMYLSFVTSLKICCCILVVNVSWMLPSEGCEAQTSVRARR